MPDISTPLHPAQALTITILGCGGSGGVPGLGGVDGRGDWGDCDPKEPRNRRTRSAIVIQSPGGARLLVDAGPDMRAQLLSTGLSHLDAVLFTHAHADHTLGLDDLRMVNRVIGDVLPTFGTERTLVELKQRFGYAFLESTAPYFFRPALATRSVEAGQVLRSCGMDIRLFRQDHAVMDTLGLRIGNFAYSTDVVRLPDESLAQLHGLDTWVVGCMQRTPHKVHADLGQVLAWVKELRPRRTILTHMGPGMDWAALERDLPPGIEAAHDGMSFTVPMPVLHSAPIAGD